MNEYNKWFHKTKDEFCPIFQRFKGKPILYVEIGCFAGAACSWVASNVLSEHPDAWGIGIDPYPPDGRRTPEQIEAVKQHAAGLLKPYEDAGKWRWYYRDSVAALRGLDRWALENCPKAADLPSGLIIDCLYIDGLHLAHGALLDFCMAWEYLRPGSVAIFDDFGIGKRKTERHVPEAVEAIKIAFGDKIKQIGYGPKQVSFEVLTK